MRNFYINLLWIEMFGIIGTQDSYSLPKKMTTHANNGIFCCIKTNIAFEKSPAVLLGSTRRSPRAVVLRWLWCGHLLLYEVKITGNWIPSTNLLVNWHNAIFTKPVRIFRKYTQFISIMRNANTNINDKIFYEQFLFPNTEEVYFFFLKW